VKDTKLRKLINKLPFVDNEEEISDILNKYDECKDDESVVSSTFKSYFEKRRETIPLWNKYHSKEYQTLGTYTTSRVESWNAALKRKDLTNSRINELISKIEDICAKDEKENTSLENKRCYICPALRGIQKQISNYIIEPLNSEAIRAIVEKKVEKENNSLY